MLLKIIEIILYVIHLVVEPIRRKVLKLVSDKDHSLDKYYLCAWSSTTRKITMTFNRGVIIMKKYLVGT